MRPLRLCASATACTGSSGPPSRCRPIAERGTFGRDGDSAAVDFPGELVAGADVEGIADFLRHGRLSLAGDGRARHQGISLQILACVRNSERRPAKVPVRLLTVDTFPAEVRFPA